MTTSTNIGTTNTKTNDKNQARGDVYTRVTDRIVADLQSGTKPWMKPWAHSGGDGHVGRPVRHNGIAYRGINIVVLWSEAMDKGFSASMWMTYQQAHELGAHVRKGGQRIDEFTRTHVKNLSAPMRGQQSPCQDARAKTAPWQVHAHRKTRTAYADMRSRLHAALLPR